jgi:hypothetical protein
VVAFLFLAYANDSGQPFWRKATDHFPFVLVIALNGLVIGGLAGATCKPILATLLGGFLSGGSCFGLFVVPTVMLIGIDGDIQTQLQERLTIVMGVIAMAIAGALAGGIGAVVGRLRKRELQNKYQDRDPSYES